MPFDVFCGPKKKKKKILSVVEVAVEFVNMKLIVYGPVTMIVRVKSVPL